LSRLTTHVLDTAKGCPAVGIKVTVERQTATGVFEAIGGGVTNSDGRVPELLKPEYFARGIFRIRFETSSYHDGKGFFPYVEIVFDVKNPDQHHHVPLLISPFGFSTYRGS
jgi:5-hydroxyisourate hydrolase